MAGSRKLTVEIIGDAKGLGRAFGDAENSAKGLGDGLTKLDDTNSKKMENIGKMAGAAALAIGAFAVGSVIEFQNLGIEVGKFRDATGLSVEAASRWIEVAGDLGIESSTLQGALNKMNIAAGKSPQLFKDLGVEIVRTRDGAVDVNATFLNVIDRLNNMKDPAERAEAGAKLLGKGWTASAELVGMGSDEITKKLDQVAGNKIFTDKDVTSAKGLRTAFDSIGDAVDELQLSLGKTLAPTIAELGQMIAGVVEAAGPLVTLLGEVLVAAMEELKPIVTVVGDLVGALGFLAGATSAADEESRGLLATWIDYSIPFDEVYEGFADLDKVTGEYTDATGKTTSAAGFLVQQLIDEQTALEEAAQSTSIAEIETAEYNAALVTAYERQYKAGEAARVQAEKLGESQRAAGVARDAQYELERAAQRVEDTIRRQNEQWDILNGKLDTTKSALDMSQQFDDLVAKIGSTTEAFNAGSISQEQAMRDVAQELITTKQKVIDYATAIGGIPANRVTEILAKIDRGDYANAERELTHLARARQIQMQVSLRGEVGRFTIVPGQTFATGGVVQGPIGSPQMILAHAGETVLPTHKQSISNFGGASTTIINNYFQGPVMGEQDFIRRLEEGRQEAIRRGALLVPA